MILFYHQSKSIPTDFTSRDYNGNSTPESVKDTEPYRQFEDTLESVKNDDFIPDRIEEPLRSYVAQERRDSLQEQEIEDIPLEEPIRETVADALGDNGVPLDELIDDKQDSPVDGM